VAECIDHSNEYLNANRGFFNERAITGCRRDGHGDLKSGNIFLYDPPVIFDCIEFNDSFRQLDVLNDIAFLSVDLDFYGREDLAAHFYQEYMDANNGISNNRDASCLFNYFKAYRANVKAKVTALRSKQTKPEPQAVGAVEKYIGLMADYTNNC